ncbi:N-acetyltransferase [Sedimentitalea sp. JM2-8]|uniref:N-acetyltransferase n=1 Tax=Sedimentitalea xiamensis TaxID=3050037 RepID=A0ABT7FI87_9RHOB|nr:N-acetyltransferase [Sedimentitalea xiamensis]MDK3074760.1 N-acetyltransferase [Sedimentitalea xiamensis]
MTDFRKGKSNDIEALERLYPAAFPDEDLLPLVRALTNAPGVLSVVACDGTDLIGHAAFTRCSVAGTPVALLGPVAVAPARQDKGLGGALIRQGLDDLGQAGVAQVMVLGDPAYYGRFGFRADAAVAAPYPLPEAWAAAWQSLHLGDGPAAQGVLEVPDPWRDPALWS